MGFAHILNLYKDQTILQFRRGFASEKVHGCLKKGTMILMADRSEKSIELISSGDLVISFDEKQKRFVSSEVECLLIQESDKRLGWMEVILENGRVVVCTTDHPFLTKNRGWVPAKNLLVSDDIIDFNISLYNIQKQ